MHTQVSFFIVLSDPEHTCSKVVVNSSSWSKIEIFQNCFHGNRKWFTDLTKLYLESRSQNGVVLLVVCDSETVNSM